MWQITRVARLRPRLTIVYWPLRTRACLIAPCAVTTLVAQLLAEHTAGSQPGPWRTAIAPALLLLLVAALGTIPLPSTVPVWLQPLTEALAAALVVGALRGAELFLPYVLVPLASAGLTAGMS